MKYKQIKTNLKPEEYEKIKQIAQENNLTLSSYVRKILNMENELDNKKDIDIEKLKLIYELNKIGNNLNQIAKRVNINKIIDFKVFEQLEKIEEELRRLRK